MHLKLTNIVHKDSNPQVVSGATINEVIIEISNKRLGATAVIDNEKLVIKLGEMVVAENGKISENHDEQKLKEYMKWDSVFIEVNLNQGSESFECYTCDFTHDYIDINTDYRN